MFPDDQHVNPAVLRTHGGTTLGKAAALLTDAKTHSLTEQLDVLL